MKFIFLFFVFVLLRHRRRRCCRFASPNGLERVKHSELGSERESRGEICVKTSIYLGRQ
jgi:hypothetical protein